MGRANIKKHGLYCSYVVSRYKPSGNWGGEYTNNVHRGSFTKDLCERLDAIVKSIPNDDVTGHNDDENGDEPKLPDIKVDSDADHVHYTATPFQVCIWAHVNNRK